VTVSIFDLAGYLEREKLQVEAALERALEALLPHLEPELHAPARHGVMTGGKRLRPILCVAAWRAVAADDHGHGTDAGAEDGATVDGTSGPETPYAVYDLAVSVELIHAYSLMHDDLPCMDDAELRRGRATPHTLYGEAATARAGLALIPAAGIRAWEGAKGLACDDEVASAIVRDLAEAAGAGGMVGGQALDLLGEGRRLGADELDELHRRKTGALLTASLTIGGRAAGATDDELGALTRYGRAVGLAFQIADDILDATSSAEVLGKNPSDAELDKSTYVGLHGLEAARERAWQLSGHAREALRGAGLTSRALDALADYVVERSR